MKNDNEMHNLFILWYEENKLLFKEEKVDTEAVFSPDSMWDTYECMLEKKNRSVLMTIAGEQNSNALIYYYINDEEVKQISVPLGDLLFELEAAKTFILS